MKKQELESLILDLFDREINEFDFARLEEELSISGDSRERFRELAYIQSQLEARPASKGHQLLDSPLPAAQRRTLNYSIGIAAGIIALLALTLYFIQLAKPTGTLAFEVAPDSQFRVTSTSGKKEIKDGTLPVGYSMELSQGTVELQFESGVRSIVTAPASLTLNAPNQLLLHEGSAWFHVPKQGEGFQVRTNGLHITDYGTEFGVINVPGSTDEVHVFQGRVKVRALSGLKTEKMLTKGNAVRAGIRGDLKAPPNLKTPFLKQLPDRLPYLHFPFDEVRGDQSLAKGQHQALDDLSVSLIQSDKRPADSRLIKGRFGNAIAFDGKGDVIQTNWPGIFGAQPVTVAFWMKPAKRRSWAGIVSWGTSKYETEANQQWKFVLPPAEPHMGELFRCSWGQSGMTHVPLDIPEAKWTHFAVVYTGDSSSQTPTLHFYIDGEKITPPNPKTPSPPRRPSDLDNALPLYFGHQLDAPKGSREYERNFLSGALDEVFIIEGALTHAQIDQIYRENVYSP